MDSERRGNQRLDVPRDMVSTQGFGALNLSEGGMLLECDESYAVGSTLHFSLHVGKAVIGASATVKWCTQDPSAFGSKLHCGVEFVGLKASDLLAVRTYVADHS